MKRIMITVAVALAGAMGLMAQSATAVWQGPLTVWSQQDADNAALMMPVAEGSGDAESLPPITNLSMMHKMWGVTPEMLGGERQAVVAPLLPGATLADGTVNMLPTSVDENTAALTRSMTFGKQRKAAADRIPALKEMAGKYILLYGGGTDPYMRGGLLTSYFTMTVNNDGTIDLEGFMGTGKNTLPQNTMFQWKQVKTLKANYDEVTGEITIMPMQELAHVRYDNTMTDVGIFIEPGYIPQPGGQPDKLHNMVIHFKYIRGRWYCTTDLVVNGYDVEHDFLIGTWVTYLPSMFAAQPIIVPVNGNVQYDYTTNEGQKHVGKDVAYGFDTYDYDGEDLDVMWLSSVAPSNSYLTQWVVDGDVAGAVNQVTYAQVSNGEVRDYYLGTYYQEQVASVLEADVADRTNIVWPTMKYPQYKWAIFSADGYSLGINERATLKGNCGPAEHYYHPYVSIYTPYFSNYRTDMPMSCNLAMKRLGDSRVEFDGLGGVGSHLASIDPAYTDVQTVTGYVDPKTGNITIATGQTVATYNGNTELKLYGADLKNHRYFAADTVITLIARGRNYVADMDLYVAGNGKSYAAQVEPVIMKPNANIVYTAVDGTGEHAVNDGVWYTYGENEDGPCIYMSNIIDRAPAGYVTTWSVNGDRAVANEQMAYSKHTGTTERAYYLSSVTAEGKRRAAIVAEIDSVGNIHLPQVIGKTEYTRWGAFTAEGYNFGFNFPATITGKAADAYEAVTRLYVIGDFNGWNTDEPAMLTDRDGIYQLTLPDGTRQIKISTTPGSSLDAFNIGAFSIGSGMTLNAGSSCVLIAGDDNITIDADGPCTIYIDLRSMKIWAEAGVANGIEDCSIDNDADAQPVYYNMQGMRVDNPTSGIYIRRSGKNVEKVYVK